MYLGTVDFDRLVLLRYRDINSTKKSQNRSSDSEYSKFFHTVGSYSGISVLDGDSCCPLEHVSRIFLVYNSSAGPSLTATASWFDAEKQVSNFLLVGYIDDVIYRLVLHQP